MFLRPTDVGASCGVALQKRLGAQVALSGQSQRAHPRAEFQSRSRAENLHQSKADQGFGQSGRAQPQALAATGLDDRSARAVSYLLLAGTHLWQGQASGWPNV